MKLSVVRLVAAAGLTGLLCLPSLGFSASDPKEKEKEKKPAEETIVLSPFCVSSSVDSGAMGVTVGGAKDVRFFRNAAIRGDFPHPNTITAEGLFSEHDLPLKTKTRSNDLLVLNGEAISAALLTRPEVRYLAQIGLSSGLDARTWQREPLNLVAVVDKSGSMSGERINLVKDCLHKVVAQLGADDQLSIVLYGDHSYVHLEPTRTTRRNREDLDAAIDAIAINGSTNMEEGLAVGFELARRSQRNFHGRTRVMQFTDERPNVGDTSAAGFMGLMAAASHDGIGQTTIGVGEEFGAELATKVSAVRGGNLFYFGNRAEMEKTFTEELDLLVTEMAYDLDVTIHPAPGLRVAGVYGIPGEKLKWQDERSVRFQVTTLFLSKRRGAIYVAFAPDNADLPDPSDREDHSLATVKLSYLEAGRDHSTSSRLELPLVNLADASLGLKRGRLLVNEYLGLKGAMTAHLIENNQEKARGLLADLHELLADSDHSMRGERKLVAGLLTAMSERAGHGENVAANDDEEAEPDFGDLPRD